MSKKKTHEEYVAELAIKNPAVKVVGEYIGADKKILHYCTLHNEYWETTPSRALNGVGCEKCRLDKFRKATLKTHEQYIKEVETINPGIEVVGNYIDAKTPIEHRCKIHNISWFVSPDNILKGHGCVECGKEKIGNKKRKSHEQYIKELKRINQNIIVIEDYVNANTPILHKCMIDGHEWKASPGNILNGTGCPKCGKTLKKTHEEYVFDVNKIKPNIEVLDLYINARTPIRHKCKKDGYIWLVAPESILSGCGCPKCANNIKKTHEEYISEVYNINKDIEVVDKYINSTTPIRHKCKIHNHIWIATPTSILNGTGCPICHESKGERLTRQWLEKNNIRYEFQYIFKDCIDINPLPFDFYLPDYNVAIEYQGEQHYRSVDFFGGEEKFKIQQKHDNIKREYCKNNNIRLLEIPYFSNVEEELNNFLFI